MLRILLEYLPFNKQFGYYFMRIDFFLPRPKIMDKLIQKKKIQYFLLKEMELTVLLQEDLRGKIENEKRVL